MEQTIQEQIKSGLKAYYKIAKTDIKKRWNKFDDDQKRASARALAEMYDVATKPERYLSKKFTESEWRIRASQYASQYNIEPNWMTFHCVASPAQIILDKARAACFDQMASDYRAFLETVQNYEYDSGLLKQYYANMIDKLSKEVGLTAALLDKPNPVARITNSFVQSK